MKFYLGTDEEILSYEKDHSDISACSFHPKLPAKAKIQSASL